MNFEIIRKKAGFSQTELAKRLSLNQTTVSKWESGESSPKRKDIKKLASILNVSVEEILECFE